MLVRSELHRRIIGSSSHIDTDLNKGMRPVRPHDVRLENAPFDTRAVAAAIAERAFGFDDFRDPTWAEAEALTS